MEMRSINALAIALATVLMTSVAASAGPQRPAMEAARDHDVQAPRGQEMQLPRGENAQAARDQDAQAPRR